MGSCKAENVIWDGQVNADGSPTLAIELILDQPYQIRARGIINLGKWWQNSQPLANDACYEFNTPEKPTQLTTLKNSLSISVCDGKYHGDHTYLSLPFVAKQNKIHFWIDDTDYSDNSGSFQVQIIQLGGEAGGSKEP